MTKVVIMSHDIVQNKDSVLTFNHGLSITCLEHAVRLLQQFY